MKTSIITATFNSGQTIRDTLESVLRQTFTNYEYIIKDGGSKDNTLEIVKEYAPQFGDRLKIVSAPDKGIYDAMNQGFQMASGDVLALINSDDFFSDDHALEKVAKTFAENPETDGVYADLYYVSQDNIDNIVRKWVTGAQKPFAKGWLPAHPTFYVKRECYERYGYFNLAYKLAADFELMLRFVERHHIKLTYLPEALVKMRLGGATSKNIQNIINQGQQMIAGLSDFPQILSDRLRIIQPLLCKCGQSDDRIHRGADVVRHR